MEVSKLLVDLKMERDRLRVVNAKLLAALEALMPDMSVIVGAYRIEEGPDNVSGPERRRNEALDAIEEAKN